MALQPSFSSASSSSSSSFGYGCSYDVFLSFRGADTRYSFTGNLNKALRDKGIHTFFDDQELEGGEEITPTLVKAIEESRIAIAVFSTNYASSSFCLVELAKIIECFKANGRLVLPVFYNVDPSHVRRQRGSYEEAMAKHEKRFKDDIEKVKKWREALSQVADLSGYHFKHGVVPSTPMSFAMGIDYGNFASSLPKLQAAYDFPSENADDSFAKKSLLLQHFWPSH